MSPSEHPHLRPAPEPPPESSDASPTERNGPPWVPILLVVALLFCAGGWAWQAREGARLESELAATRTALVAAEARVEALEGYVGSVRDRFATLRETLQGELEALGALLSDGPE